MDGREAVEMFAASFTGYYDLIHGYTDAPWTVTRPPGGRAMERSDSLHPIVAMTNAFTEDISYLEAGMNQHMAKSP